MEFKGVSFISSVGRFCGPRNLAKRISGPDSGIIRQMGAKPGRFQQASFPGLLLNGIDLSLRLFRRLQQTNVLADRPGDDPPNLN